MHFFLPYRKVTIKLPIKIQQTICTELKLWDSFLPPASQKLMSILSWYDQRVTCKLNSYKVWPHVHLVQTIQPISCCTGTPVKMFIAGKIQIKLPQKFYRRVQLKNRRGFQTQFSCWQKDLWYFISYCFDVSNSYFFHTSLCLQAKARDSKLMWYCLSGGFVDFFKPCKILSLGGKFYFTS